MSSVDCIYSTRSRTTPRKTNLTPSLFVHAPFNAERGLGDTRKKQDSHSIGGRRDREAPDRVPSDQGVKLVLKGVDRQRVCNGQPAWSATLRFLHRFLGRRLGRSLGSTIGQIGTYPGRVSCLIASPTITSWVLTRVLAPMLAPSPV